MSINIEDYIENPIKRHIIVQIMKNKKMKYSELMPQGVDNVLFNYHLQHLVKSGLLVKEDNYYSFSVEGWNKTSHITYDGLFLTKFVGRYKLYVINEGKILLHQRKISPWNGDTTVIWGKMVYGEETQKVVSTQLREKTGLEAKMRLVGTLRSIVYTPQKDILDDSLYYICLATDAVGKLNSQDENRNPLVWYDLDKALELEKNNKGSGEKTIEIMKRFKDSNFDSFTFEETITAKSL